MLSAAIKKALGEIADRLERRQVEYCVGGSVMLALNGFDVDPEDIDIAVNAGARPVVVDILSTYTDRARTDLWRSEWALRTEWDVEDGQVGVDVIGDLRVMVDGAEASFPVAAERRVTIGGHDIAVAPLRHWYHLYRVHRPAKAELIASRLSDSEIVAGARELGIGAAFSPTLIVRIGNESPQQEIEQPMSTEQQSSIIEVASPTDRKFDESPAAEIDMSLLNETLEYIRPALQADGGDLVLLGTEGGKVTLQLVGACGGCPLSTMTLTAGIERIVQDRVPGVTEVVAV
jgi:Fe-S cluster biogenesis protein NfuA